MAPKKNPTTTAIVHNTNIETSAGQANNQAVTGRDLDMLAQNLTTTFAEQLCAIVSANAATPHEQVLADMVDQIKNLKESIEPTNSSSQKSDDRDTQISRSSRRNRKRREKQTGFYQLPCL